MLDEDYGSVRKQYASTMLAILVNIEDWLLSASYVCTTCVIELGRLRCQVNQQLMIAAGVSVY